MLYSLHLVSIYQINTLVNSWYDGSFV